MIGSTGATGGVCTGMEFVVGGVAVEGILVDVD